MAAPPSQFEGRALLGMARDNRHEEIAAAVQLGIPVDWANPVREERSRQRAARFRRVGRHRHDLATTPSA